VIVSIHRFESIDDNVG